MGHYGYIQFKPFSRNVGLEDVVGNLPPCSIPCPNGNGSDAPNREIWRPNTDRYISEGEQKTIRENNRLKAARLRRKIRKEAGQ